MKNKDVYINGRKVLRWFKVKGKKYNVPIFSKKVYFEKKEGKLVPRNTPRKLSKNKKQKRKEKKIKWGIDKPYKEYKLQNYTARSVKNEFYEETKKRKGHFFFPGLKCGVEEYECGEWLRDTFGGEISYVREERNRKNYDYLWNGESWELKTFNNPKLNTIEGKVVTAINQISVGKKPTGIILNITNAKHSYNDIVGAIARGIDTSGQNFSVTVIIRKGNDTVDILKYKRKNV